MPQNPTRQVHALLGGNFDWSLESWRKTT